MKRAAMTLQESTKQHPGASFESVDHTEQLLESAVLRLNANILGVGLGIIGGIGIFVVTNFLILKGGEVVGPHLSLLRNFFPFYSVSFTGSLVGFGWGFLSGYVAGFFIASIYNFVVKLKSG
jgi:hypothetical protein